MLFTENEEKKGENFKHLGSHPSVKNYNSAVSYKEYDFYYTYFFWAHMSNL